MPERRDRKLDRYLLEGERVVVDVRQHWGVIAGPIALVAASLVFVLYVDAHVRLDGGPFARALWLLWFGAFGWMAYQIVEWRHDRFIATDRRLLMDYGIFTTKVAMMPLIKVTDMSFRRSVPGRIFGYGQFILESAGQDQALRQIDWVPDPDHTYRVICAEIFGVLDDREGDEDDTSVRDDKRRRWGMPQPLYRVANPLGRRPSAHPESPEPPEEVESAVQEPRRWTFSRAIPLHQRGEASPIPSGEVKGTDDEEARRRLADTGPLPVTRPKSDD